MYATKYKRTYHQTKPRGKIWAFLRHLHQNCDSLSLPYSNMSTHLSPISPCKNPLSNGIVVRFKMSRMSRSQMASPTWDVYAGAEGRCGRQASI